MRKETISNNYVSARGKNSTLFDCVATMLRRRADSRNSKNSFGNPNASKINIDNTQHRYGKWVADKVNQIVIIDDSRQEINNVGYRGLLTTSLIIEEILQTNRGHQDYEYEKNKFHVQDDTTNSTEIISEGTLAVLDLLWYMREQGLDALTIDTEGMDTDERKTFHSQRYEDVLATHRSTHKQRYYDIISDAFNTFWVNAKTASANTNLEIHDDNFATDSDWWGEYYYTRISEIGCEYWNVCVSASQKGENPIGLETFLDGYCERFNQKYTGMNLIMQYLTTQLGYSDVPTDNDNFVEWYHKSRTYYHKTIARSAFKRNKDYKTSQINTIKCEALQLRSKFMEDNNV